MWFYFALLSALLNGFSNIARRTHGSLADPAELSWWSLLISLPLAVGLLLSSNTRYFSSHAFIVPLVLTGLINSLASVLQFKAYKLADASLVSPILNLIPLFMVVTSFVILGVTPSWNGLAGILLIVCGVYYSSVSGKHALHHPLKQMFKSAGSRAMLCTVLLWSISTNLDKISLRSASPAFLMVGQLLIMLVCISGYLLTKPRRNRLKRGNQVIQRWGWHIVAISVFTTLAVYFQLQAVKLVANPSYVLAVKRLDVLVTILFAGYFLHEKHILKRFKGALIAVLGVIIIYL